MRHIWEIRLASDGGWPNLEEPGYWVRLRVDDLEDRVRKELAQYTARYAAFHDLEKGPAWFAEQFRTLRAFHQRLRKEANGSRKIEIGLGEMPVSFNDEVFAGEFVEITCNICKVTSCPEQTYVQPFWDEDGLQYYGKSRRCPCGQPIAYKIEGYRRP